MKTRFGRNKFNAKRTEVDGRMFDSGLEADVYKRLVERLNLGQIQDLELQPKFPLILDGKKITPRPYRADFRYLDLQDQQVHIVDAKGVDTREGKLRRRLAEVLHDVVIEVVR